MKNMVLKTLLLVSRGLLPPCTEKRLTSEGSYCAPTTPAVIP
jgi:hypothetical protein